MKKIFQIISLFLFIFPSLNAQDYWAQSGTWLGDLSNYGFARASGLTNNGGEFVVWQKNGQCGTLIDGSYLAYENGGFYTSYTSNFNNLVGFNATSDGAFNINVANVKAGGNTIWHSGNLNRSDTDFSTKNLYVNGTALFGAWALNNNSWPGTGGFTYNGGDITFGIHSTSGQASLQIDGAFIQAEPQKTNTYAGASAFNNTVNFPGTGIWNTSGNVGIGTTSPDEKLTVNGVIHAKEVKVDLSGALADFVFKPDYKLMSLNQVEQFVKTNNHLPQMPSAEEVDKNGLSVGEMQNKLLQKVEELTLYMIGQQKTIDQQQAQIKELNNKLSNLNKQ
jgi:hypothetical protein